MANLVSYAKQKWEDAKTAITAARLNNMEDGISNCAAQINALGDSVSPSIVPGPIATANDGFKIVDSYAVKLGKNLVSLSITFAANNDKKAGTTGLNPFSLSGAYRPKCGTLVGNDAVCGHITSGGNAWITQIADIKEGVNTTVETPAYICF